MPVHDWTRVDAGIFHHFHHGWIEELARSLNRGLLPADYYALAEQHAAGFGPDVLTLQADRADRDESPEAGSSSAGGGVVLAAPRLQPVAETDMAFYRRKQKSIAVRHITGDRLVAMVEVVSPGNKASRHPLRAFVQKAGELIDRQIHLLILDLLPPGRRDPQGIHGEIWEEVAGQEYIAPCTKPLTLAAYAERAARAVFTLNAHLATHLLDNLEHDRQAQPVFQMLDVANMVVCCEQLVTGCGWNAWTVVTHPELDYTF